MFFVSGPNHQDDKRKEHLNHQGDKEKNQEVLIKVDQSPPIEIESHQIETESHQPEINILNLLNGNKKEMKIIMIMETIVIATEAQTDIVQIKEMEAVQT